MRQEVKIKGFFLALLVSLRETTAFTNSSNSAVPKTRLWMGTRKLRLGHVEQEFRKSFLFPAQVYRIGGEPAASEAGGGFEARQPFTSLTIAAFGK